jgi:bifunctional ADP-heptose synthase (sugar kinase/adenylyltransferase)
MSTMLTDALIEHILGRLPSLTIGVLGDLFLDRYLDIEASLTEKSIETGLDAYQVVRVRACPGALGTIINNLVALGVGRVCAVSLVGDDGEGYELRQALEAMKVVDSSRVYTARDLRTPTYTKPMLHQAGKAPHELNRLDIKNRTPTPGPLQDLLIEAIHDIWPQVDALIVLDQVSEEDCGVVTARLREELGKLGESQPEKFVLADSRERIGLFRSVSVKPNEAEVEKALWAWGLPTELRGGGLSPVRLLDFEAIIQEFAKRMDRTVFCTLGEWGICLAVRGLDGVQIAEVGAYPVAGPIDPVGAGDSTSAGISSAVAAGASLEEAAAFGCLVASITIQQIGTTGTASADQVRRRWREVNQGPHSPSGRG